MAGALIVISIEVLLVIVCSELLVRNLPESIEASMAANCRRLDGTWSRNRQHIERKARKELRRNLVAALLFVLAPTSFLVYWVHTNIIPLSIGRDALFAMRRSQEEWKDSLRTDGTEADFDRWQQAEAGVHSYENARWRKRLLWRSWPVVAGIMLIWCVVSFVVVKSVYLSSLRGLARAIEYRSQRYFYRDLSRLPPVTRDDSPRNRQ